jgi:capsule biosynthesis phosphatase
MKIAIDIDGTICELRKNGEAYADVVPLPGAVAKLKALKGAGHYLILATARHMATCNGNVGQVMARQGKTLFQWLEKHDVPFDEIWFGKPHADVYIDDNAYRFTTWELIADDGSNLPISKEKQLGAKPETRSSG